MPADVLRGGDFSLGASRELTLPGGHYYVHDLELGGSSTLAFTGPAEIYVTGRVSLGGSTRTNGSLPKNLKIVVLSSGSVAVGGSGTLHATIYAPQSPVTLGGSCQVYGSVLGRTVEMSGSSAVHYEPALRAGGITMVQ